MPQPQSYKNHTRWRPMFHFTIMPILMANLIIAIYYDIHYHWKHVHMGTIWVILSVVLILIALDHRGSALGAQDRIIRLEERLRMTILGVPHNTIHALTERQFVGLRFAADSELPSLAERAVRDGLTEKQIKASIQNWRADHFRI
jgi:uncharacterized membrane protein